LDLQKLRSIQNLNSPMEAECNEGGCIAFNRRMNFLNFDSTVV